LESESTIDDFPDAHSAFGRNQLFEFESPCVEIEIRYALLRLCVASS